MYNYLYIADIEISEMRILIMRVLNKHYTALTNLPKIFFEDVAAELYSVGLVSTGIQRTPTFDNIIKEFEAGMSFKRSLTELQEYLIKFLTSLKKVGGSFATLASVLQDEWTKTIRRELKFELDLYYLTNEDSDYDDNATTTITSSVLQDEWTKTIRRELKFELDLYYLTSKSEKRIQHKRQRTNEDSDYDDNATTTITKRQPPRLHNIEFESHDQSTRPHDKEPAGEKRESRQ